MRMEKLQKKASQLKLALALDVKSFVIVEESERKIVDVRAML